MSTTTEKHSTNQFVLVLLSTFLVIAVWSGYAPKDRFTWWLEVGPAFVGLAVAIATYPRFKLTRLSYAGIWLEAMLMFIGGHYTYAEVPLFNWIKDALDLPRNHYDRVGHFVQGFFPAILARELLIRTSPVRPGKWLVLIVTCICLSIGALYELFEWLSAMLFGGSSTAFLGTQGDEWDAQWDMGLCLLGAIMSQLLLTKWHDRQLKAMGVHLK